MTRLPSGPLAIFGRLRRIGLARRPVAADHDRFIALAVTSLKNA